MAIGSRLRQERFQVREAWLEIAAATSKAADLGEMRRLWDDACHRYSPAEGIGFTAKIFGGIPCEWIDVSRARQDKIVIYLHGGGYLSGSARGYRGLAAGIGAAAGAKVITVDYRLGPEHAYPAAVDDAVSVYNAILSDGYDSASIVIAGDSAGAGLTAALLAALRDAGHPLPAAAYLMSPYADLSCSGESMVLKADAEPVLKLESVKGVAAAYLQGADPLSPTASPVFADLRGLPPLLIQVGSEETLLDDSVRLARQAGLAGVPVQLEIYSGQYHVFQLFQTVSSEARRSVEKAGQFLAEAMGAL